MVTVFGLGFVGLTTALGFADLGYQVFGVDTDEARKELLRNGDIPFHEPDLGGVLRAELNKRFFVTDDVRGAVSQSEYIFFCVGTPYGENGSADLRYLFSAIDTAADAIRDERFRVMVVKSTVPPSTTAEQVSPYVSAKGKKILVANNPEFLREGHCWEDFHDSSRVVLGCDDERAREALVRLYKPLGAPVCCVSRSTGEFIKYLSNTLLATMISYSNEMARVADAIGGIEVGDAFRILHMDKRWNHCDMTSYVYPGCGYGGYCLPKDTCALYAASSARGFEPPILKNVIETNERMPETIAKKITAGLSVDQRIGVLGLAFKPGSDDVRDTPAAKIIKALNSLGYRNICAYDPVAADSFAHTYPELNIEYMRSAEAVCQTSEAAAIVTAWDEFKVLKDMKGIVDCRYMLS